MTSMLSGLAEQWTAIYSNHAALRTVVTFAHVGGIVGGGGCAIAADRATLGIPGDDDAGRRARLASIGSLHRTVIAGLVAVMASGGLMLLADLDTFLTSRVFWTKMGLVALLIVNGGLMVRYERRAGSSAHAWRQLRVASVTSLALWFLTTFAGVALENVG
jgi:hypothetical protein